MKASSPQQMDAAALEDLGLATFRIVHDLKNQLNGLKLYATFLRKRLDRDNHSPEEREIVEKLVAGLDRAARDLSALVRYAHPLELRQRPHTDLRAIIKSAAHDPAHRVTGALNGNLAAELDDTQLVGNFDAHAIAEAFSALAREASAATPQPDGNISLNAQRGSDNGCPTAVIEWSGLHPFNAGAEPGINGSLARRIIEAHGGAVEFDQDTIRVTLPLTQ